MCKPKITIVVPVYNTGKYLEKCMQSLISQTMEELEIICVNDGSTDNSLALLEHYQDSDSRVRVINQKNQGLSEARNTGIRAATAEYLMFLDSDDWIDPETCDSAFAAARDYGADIVIWSYVREFANLSLPQPVIDQESDTAVFGKGKQGCNLHRRILGLIGDELRTPEKIDSLVTAWGKLYKTALITDSQIKFIDTKIIGTEDALFNVYVFGTAETIVSLNHCYHHYRKDNQGSLTKSYKPKLYQQWQTLFGYMQDYIADNNLGPDYQQALDNRRVMSIVGLGLNVLSSDGGARKKIGLVKEIICSEEYRRAVKNFNLKYLPVHWKVFYLSAQSKNAAAVYALLLCIQKMIQK